MTAFIYSNLIRSSLAAIRHFTRNAFKYDFSAPCETINFLLTEYEGQTGKY